MIQKKIIQTGFWILSSAYGRPLANLHLLPKPYKNRLIDYLENCNRDEWYTVPLKCFIQESTGETLKTISDLLEKQIKIKTALSEIEKDFKPIESLNLNKNIEN